MLVELTGSSVSEATKITSSYWCGGSSPRSTYSTSDASDPTRYAWHEIRDAKVYKIGSTAFLPDKAANQPS